MLLIYLYSISKLDFFLVHSAFKPRALRRTSEKNVLCDLQRFWPKQRYVSYFRASIPLTGYLFSDKSFFLTSLSKHIRVTLCVPGKGQQISEANFLVLIWTKKRTKLFFDFCPKDLKWVKSKSKCTYCVKYPYLVEYSQLSNKQAGWNKQAGMLFDLLHK